MFEVKEVRKVITGLGPKLKNVCYDRKGNEICYHADGYHYITKANKIGRAYKF